MEHYLYEIDMLIDEINIIINNIIFILKNYYNLNIILE